MDPRNILIVCVWAFVITVVIAYLWAGQVLEFFGILLIFFIALISTVAIAFGMRGNQK